MKALVPDVLLAIALIVHPGCGDPDVIDASDPSRQTQSSASYTCPQNPPPPVFPPGVSQIGDATYCPQLASPAYAFEQGPRVLYDEGHNNFGTLSNVGPNVGLYYAFGELLRADGYRVTVHKGPFTDAALSGHELLVINHALASPYFVYNADLGRSVHNPKAYECLSAYTTAEIAAIKKWVFNGGSLLLNAEHVPFPEAVIELAKAFKVQLFGGEGGNWSAAPSFDIPAPSHPILKGRGASETVKVVPFVAGGAKIVASGGTPLFRWPLLSVGMDVTPEAWRASFQYLECTASDAPAWECDKYRAIQAAGTTWHYAGGEVPAMAVTHGKGRIVVFTEFATLTHQLLDMDGDGVPDPGTYGGLEPGGGGVTQLVLNTLHWLSFLI